MDEENAQPTLPPPLTPVEGASAAPAPPIAEERPAAPPPWRLWGALLVFVVAADVGLFKVSAPGAGLAFTGAWTALLAAWVSRGAGRVALGTIMTLGAVAAMLLEPSLSSAIVFAAGFCLLAWMDGATEIPHGFARAPLRVLMAIPNALAGVPPTHRAVAQTLRKRRFDGVGRAFKLVLPAVLVSLVFLFLLTRGNAVLARWVGAAWDVLRGLLALVSWPSAVQMSFWFWMLVCGVLLFAPALRCKENKGDGGFLARRRERPASASAELQWILVLAGVNVVFLLTNTLDAVYLWVRVAPPEGVSTTDYLYEGVYWLIATTLLAGGLLAAAFNGDTRPRWLRGLGFAWVAQNVFLIVGAGLRLWLHVQHYCLTPRRVGVAFFLALVLAGFGLLTVYMLRGKSLRWLVGRNVMAVLALFFVVQFCDINRWCADSAARRLENDPEALSLDLDFLNAVGLPGWRVVKTLADGEAYNPRAYACMAEFRRQLEGGPPATQWQSWSWRESREARELCEALGLPYPDPHVPKAWRTAVKKNYLKRR